jgi:GH24 family phage-related lysozyme (muramidase)
MVGKTSSIPKTMDATSKNLAEERMKSVDAVMGIYVGEVTSTKDLARSGRVQVFISALSKDKEMNTGLYDCFWVSPFAGATPASAIGKNVERYQETQKSYGMWMIPPDVGNLVLVAFGNGNTKFPLCIGCLFPDMHNHMIPGMAAGKSFGDPNILLPVAEKNRKDASPNHNDVTRPIHADIAAGIVTQGLINDPIRGAGSSSARRESPSEVFGILTPGPRDPNNVSHRLGGHQFVMDDNLQSRLIRLRTAGGNQLLMDDTTGSIYMINKAGKGWVEIDSFGNINVFGEGSINLRAKGNFNLRADKNINIEAGNDINIKAAGDTVGSKYEGPELGMLGAGPKGSGGNIRMEAAANLDQLASLNAKVTAIGGDIDISSGGRSAISSSGTQGIDLLASFGAIKLQSAQSTSVLSSAGFSVTASAPASINAPLILLNSGGAASIPAIPAVPASRIGMNDFKDQPTASPEFDYAAALRGESSVKNNGRRPGKEIKFKTIVSNLVTAEPYSGHAQADPKTDDPFARGSSESLVSSLPNNAVNQNGAPADIQTPNGMQAGLGYVDINGNSLSNRILDNSVDISTTATKSLTSTVQTVNPLTGSSISGPKATKAVAEAKDTLNSTLNALPVYGTVPNAVNNFSTASEKKLLEISSIKNIIDGMKVAIPPIRFPTTNAVQQQIVGSIKQLKELEAQLRQFALDTLGLPADLNSDAFKNMRRAISAVIATASLGSAVIDELKKKGIGTTVDTTGSLIFKDTAGNILVDFSNGLGDVGDTLATAATLNQTHDIIKNVISVPLTNNQLLSLTSFASHIGEENFRNSNVVRALNEGKYDAVPRLMKTWSLGPPIGSMVPTPITQLVYREDYDQRRSWEAEIFQSPDNLDIGPPEGAAAGELNFQQMADLIQLRREQFILENMMSKKSP